MKLISNPSNGWCNFDVVNFHGTPSYLTDAPIDTLNAFIEYHKTGMGMAWYDEEGTEFTLVLTPYSFFIIEEKDEAKLYDFTFKIDIETLEKDLIKELKEYIDEWSKFIPCPSKSEVEEHKNEINKKISELEEVMKN